MGIAYGYRNKFSSIYVTHHQLLKTIINPFMANVPITCPLKTPENLSFSGVFRGYIMGTMARNGLIITTLFTNIDCTKFCETVIQLTLCSYLVTYAFSSESTTCSSLNVKELLLRKRRDI